jgi:hypothetical protein
MKTFAPQSSRGVALVVTLIMLSIITVVAVAFLALSHSERRAVAQSSNLLDAENAADAALERAKAQILATILADTNHWQGPGLMVSVTSTNFDDPLLAFPYGDPADGTADAQDIQKIASLRNDPRPPVFVNTNRPGIPPGPREFRYYLDLNRNGLPETNGLLPVLDATGQMLRDAAGQPIYDYFTGDPEWLGVQERLGGVHGPDNKFVSRYCFLIQPVGQTLDLNFSHNLAAQDPGQPYYHYYRREGFATYEVNLGAFLCDLNTNLWNPNTAADRYRYQPPNWNPANPRPEAWGAAFADAMELIQYRYNGWYWDQFPLRGLASLRVNQIFPPPQPPFAGWTMFVSDQIPGLAQADPTVPEDDLTGEAPWPGGASTNHFFSVHDFFDASKARAFPNFSARLRAASTNLSSYDRYTFYRMLSQLGTDSPRESGRINLNYVNIGTDLNGRALTAADLIEWTNVSLYFPVRYHDRVWTNGSELFFHAATHRMFRDEEFEDALGQAYFGRNFSWDSGIPVYVGGRAGYLVTNNNQVVLKPFYNPRVHQLLQVAANVHDAALGSKYGEPYPYYPTVFRPQFSVRGGDVFITNYVEEAGTNFLGRPWHVLEFLDPAAPNVGPDDNVYGIPLVLGARKGYPSFNELICQSAVQTERKVQLTKPSPDARPNVTNQMFLIGVSNLVGFEVWNPYTNAFPRPLEMVFGTVLTTVLTNDLGLTVVSNLAANGHLSLPANFWSGFNYRRPTNSFLLPLLTNLVALSDSVFYLTPTPGLRPAGLGDRFEQVNGSYTNKWGLMVTNRLLYYMVDNGHVVDAVAFDNLGGYFDINAELDRPLGDAGGTVANVWDTRPDGRLTRGVMNQVIVSLEPGESTDQDWRDFSRDPRSGDDRLKAISAFRVFCGFPPLPGYSTNDLPATNTALQTPFSPVRKMWQTTSWQVNDPLVHQLADHLRDDTNNAVVQTVRPRTALPDVGQNLRKINPRYKPWGGNPDRDDTASPDDNDSSVAVKDIGVRNANDWGFPTNKFANVGWVGRVHRGTPWQTVYLKAHKPDTGTEPFWHRHTGAAFMRESHPTNDWRLLDYFTVSQHPNAARGQLSINQPGLAAWSAVLSGVMVTRLVDAGGQLVKENVPIQPAAFNDPVLGTPAAPVSPLQMIWSAINRERTLNNAAPHRRFTRLGDILSVPELSIASPFLAQGAGRDVSSLLTDYDVECIPQQILSLLTLGDARFVIYCWGQSLKPAHVVASGTHARLADNYQITGEVATRSVVRIDFDNNDLTKPRAVVESFNFLPPE